MGKNHSLCILLAFSSLRELIMYFVYSMNDAYSLTPTELVDRPYLTPSAFLFYNHLTPQPNFGFPSLLDYTQCRYSAKTACTSICYNCSSMQKSYTMQIFHGTGISVFNPCVRKCADRITNMLLILSFPQSSYCFAKPTESNFRY